MREGDRRDERTWRTGAGAGMCSAMVTRRLFAAAIGTAAAMATIAWSKIEVKWMAWKLRSILHCIHEISCCCAKVSVLMVGMC